MTDQFKLFLRNYWNYYREMEDELIQTKRYVEFTEKNYKTFSIEYLKLYQAVCSEIDVLGKALASEENANFKPDDKQNNIYKWWYEIQHLTIEDNENHAKHIHLCEYECVFMDDCIIIPWSDFEVVKVRDANGRIRYSLAPGKTVPKWWTSYNEVKHNRTLVPKGAGEINYAQANLGNLMKAYAGLYVLELLKMQKSGNQNDREAFADFSRLFEQIMRITTEDIDAIFSEDQ